MSFYGRGSREMVGASGSIAGIGGIVPAPRPGDENKVLKGDGTWGYAGNDTLIAPIETSNIAHNTYEIGQQFIYNRILYTATQIINPGDKITPGDGSYEQAGTFRLSNNSTIAKIRIDNIVYEPYIGEEVPVYKNSVITLYHSATLDWSVQIDSDYFEMLGMSHSCNFKFPVSYNGLGELVVQSESNTDIISLYASTGWTHFIESSSIQLGEGKVASSNCIISDTIVEQIEPFTGATNSIAGTSGIVPAPQAGDEDKVLLGDGTWGHKLQIDIVELNGVYGYIDSGGNFVGFKSQADIDAAVAAAMVGTATAADVLSGKTFTNSSQSGISGGMTNNGAVSPSGLNCGGSYTIPAGYHNGSGKVTANSLKSQTGVDSGKTAVTAGTMVSGYQGWVNGSKISGTFAGQTKSVTATTSSQNVTPDSGKYLTKVTVSPQSHSATYTPTANNSKSDMTATHNYRYVDTRTVYSLGQTNIFKSPTIKDKAHLGGVQTSRGNIVLGTFSTGKYLVSAWFGGKMNVVSSFIGTGLNVVSGSANITMSAFTVRPDDGNNSMQACLLEYVVYIASSAKLQMKDVSGRYMVNVELIT